MDNAREAEFQHKITMINIEKRAKKIERFVSRIEEEFNELVRKTNQLEKELIQIDIKGRDV